MSFYQTNKQSQDRLITLLPPGSGISLSEYGPIILAAEGVLNFWIRFFFFSEFKSYFVDCEEAGSGIVDIVDDAVIETSVVELLGEGASLIFPCSTTLPYIIMHAKNLGKYFEILIEIMDSGRQQRKITISNHQSACRVKPFECSLPWNIGDGWNYTCLNLKDITQRAFGTEYFKTVCVQVFSNCRVWRLYFADREYADCELPPPLRVIN